MHRRGSIICTVPISTINHWATTTTGMSTTRIIQPKSKAGFDVPESLLLVSVRLGHRLPTLDISIPCVPCSGRGSCPGDGRERCSPWQMGGGGWSDLVSAWTRQAQDVCFADVEKIDQTMQNIRSIINYHLCDMFVLNKRCDVTIGNSLPTGDGGDARRPDAQVIVEK